MEKHSHGAQSSSSYIVKAFFLFYQPKAVSLKTASCTLPERAAMVWRCRKTCITQARQNARVCSVENRSWSSLSSTFKRSFNWSRWGSGFGGASSSSVRGGRLEVEHCGRRSPGRFLGTLALLCSGGDGASIAQADARRLRLGVRRPIVRQRALAVVDLLGLLVAQQEQDGAK